MTAVFPRPTHRKRHRGFRFLTLGFLSLLIGCGTQPPAGDSVPGVVHFDTETGLLLAPGATIISKGQSYDGSTGVTINGLVGIIIDGKAHLYHPVLGNVTLSDETSRRAVGAILVGSADNSAAKSYAAIDLRSLSIGNSTTLATGVRVARTGASTYLFTNPKKRWVAIKTAPSASAIFLPPRDSPLETNLIRALGRVISPGGVQLNSTVELTVGVDPVQTYGATARALGPLYNFELRLLIGAALIDKANEALKYDAALFKRLNALDYLTLRVEGLQELLGEVLPECVDALVSDAAVGTFEAFAVGLLTGDEGVRADFAVEVTQDFGQSVLGCVCFAATAGACEAVTSFLNIVSLLNWIVDDNIVGTWDVLTNRAFGDVEGVEAPPSPPGPVSSPSPANGATQVSVDADLDWADASGATSYDVYFGTSNPPPLFLPNAPASAVALSPLNYQTTYYWKVIAKNNVGNATGPVWSFTTVSSSTTSVIVGDTSGNLYFVNIATGAVIHTVNVGAFPIGQIDLIDVNLDGQKDILATPFDNDSVTTCLDGNSLTPRWTTNHFTSFPGKGHRDYGNKIWHGDFDNDGQLELVIPYYYNQSGGALLQVFSAVDGTRISTIPQTDNWLPTVYQDPVDMTFRLITQRAPSAFVHYMRNYNLSNNNSLMWENTTVNTWIMGAVANSMTDGQPRMWGGWYGRTLYVIGRTGNRLWSRSYGGSYEASAIYGGNLRGDGVEALLVGGTYGTNHVRLDAVRLSDGVPIWTFDDNTANWSIHAIATSDVNGYGAKEVFVANTHDNPGSGIGPKYQALDGQNGSRIWQAQYPPGAKLAVHAILVDADGDGDLDLLLIVNNTIEVRDCLTGALVRQVPFGSEVTSVMLRS